MNSELINRRLDFEQRQRACELEAACGDDPYEAAAEIIYLRDALSAQDSAQDEIDLIAEARGPVEAMAAENMRAHLDSAQPVAELVIPENSEVEGIELNPLPTEAYQALKDGYTYLLYTAPASAPVKDCVWAVDSQEPLADTSCGRVMRVHRDDLPTYCRECGGKIKWENSDV